MSSFVFRIYSSFYRVYEFVCRRSSFGGMCSSCLSAFFCRRVSLCCRVYSLVYCSYRVFVRLAVLVYSRSLAFASLSCRSYAIVPYFVVGLYCVVVRMSYVFVILAHLYCRIYPIAFRLSYVVVIRSDICVMFSSLFVRISAVKCIIIYVASVLYLRPYIVYSLSPLLYIRSAFFSLLS